jgi:hypothetical protein
VELANFVDARMETSEMPRLNNGGCGFDRVSDAPRGQDM